MVAEAAGGVPSARETCGLRASVQSSTSPVLYMALSDGELRVGGGERAIRFGAARGFGGARGEIRDELGQGAARVEVEQEGEPARHLEGVEEPRVALQHDGRVGHDEEGRPQPERVRRGPWT